jgi:CBS domain-containing protein
MPYLVSQLIDGRGKPVCIRAEDRVDQALKLMLEHDYSQLPVVRATTGGDLADYLITYEDILRGMRHFKATAGDLTVRDVMIPASVYEPTDDLFEILADLQKSSAVLVAVPTTNDLIGIVTGYDIADYLRDRTEDLMRVEDIELIVKEFIRAAHSQVGDHLDEVKLAEDIARVTSGTGKTLENSGKAKAFEDLTLAEYNSLLLMKECWAFLEPTFAVKKDFVRALLDDVRVIRNSLAHFRGDLTAESRDKLRFAAEWLSRRKDEFQAGQDAKHQEGTAIKGTSSITLDDVSGAATDLVTPAGFVDQSDATSDSRYGPLADWLQGQPGGINQVPLTFNQIESIIRADLPTSARQHRAWWANDSVGHSHSQLWLEAGWRTTAINLTESRVTFSRIIEREKAYIAFYSKLLDELRHAGSMPIRNGLSPDGQNWVSLWTIPPGSADGSFNYSFSRDRRMRVELYLDLGDKSRTKAVFDLLHRDCETFEAILGPISWERLDNRRASRLAQYTPGHVYDDTDHPALRVWAVKAMTAFYKALVQPAERAIKEVRQA